MGRAAEDAPLNTTDTACDAVSVTDRRAVLETAQAEDHKYRQQLLRLARKVRLRTGVTIGLVYGAFMAAAYVAFGVYANSQGDPRVRGLLGLLMYFLGFAAVPLTAGLRRLHDRIWAYHARKLGLDPEDLLEAQH